MRIPILLSFLLAVAGLGLPSILPSAEASDTDLLPSVESLTFMKNSIGLRARGGVLRQLGYAGFVYSRGSDSFAPLSKEEFTEIVGDDSERRLEQQPYAVRRSTKFLPYHCFVDSDIDGPKVVAEEDLSNVDLNKCFSVSEIVKVDGFNWVGSYENAEHGDYGSQGLLIVSATSEQLVGQVDTGMYAIRGVRYDPFSRNVWTITDDQIVVVNQHYEIVSRYFFHYDFDPESGTPLVRVSEEDVSSHPLAILAAFLPKDSHGSFHRAVQTIPKSLQWEFPLRDFFECCDFHQVVGPGGLPVEYEVLIPFLRDGAQHDPHGFNDSRLATQMWRQVSCWYVDNDHAAQLCKTEDWGNLAK